MTAVSSMIASQQLRVPDLQSRSKKVCCGHWMSGIQHACYSGGFDQAQHHDRLHS